ncbi:serine protease easter-like [Oppia nitens]|uniref:serine protease easter-like n=1 Tax=Oppia nitens TaxID=1686743 RepID=UPI0023DC749F|nr:serine protease easter-like [Oppia nitens]
MNLLYRLVLIRLLTTTTIVGIFVEIGYYPGVSNIFCGYQYGMYRIDIIPKQKCYKNKVSPYPYVDAFGNINWNLTDPRIFKGNSVDRGESPWTVLIKYDGQLTLKASYCTGVLISRKWVMTAARCNFAFGQYGSNRFPRVHVFIGDSQSREKGMRLRVQLHHIWRHPKYNPFIDFDGNDIALYRLPDKIEINTYKGFNYPIMINTICLPSNHTVFNEELELTTMAGWGEIFTTKHVNKETDQ